MTVWPHFLTTDFAQIKKGTCFPMGMNSANSEKKYNDMSSCILEIKKKSTPYSVMGGAIKPHPRYKILKYGTRYCQSMWGRVRRTLLDDETKIKKIGHCNSGNQDLREWLLWNAWKRINLKHDLLTSTPWPLTVHSTVATWLLDLDLNSGNILTFTF